MEHQIINGNSVAKMCTMGGELISYINNDVEYIWSGKPEYWKGHAPILFPTVGALKNRETEINGTNYKMKKHGFARNCEFELIKKAKDHVIYSLKSNEETRAIYPFDFELWIMHTVYTNGFKTEFQVFNKDRREILFGIGGHPGFNCPLYENTEFYEYDIIFDRIEKGPFYRMRPDDYDGVIYREDRVRELEGKKVIRLEYSLFDEDVLIIDNIKSNSLKLLNKNNKGFEFRFKGFNSIGLWTPPLKKAPFICIEPWTVNPDFIDSTGKFREKPNITRLMPNGDFSVHYEMKII